MCGGIGSNRSTPTIRNNRIVNNRGGVYLYLSDAILLGNTITSNEPVGLFIRESAPIIGNVDEPCNIYMS